MNIKYLILSAMLFVGAGLNAASGIDPFTLFASRFDEVSTNDQVMRDVLASIYHFIPETKAKSQLNDKFQSKFGLAIEQVQFAPIGANDGSCSGACPGLWFKSKSVNTMPYQLYIETFGLVDALDKPMRDILACLLRLYIPAANAVQIATKERLEQEFKNKFGVSADSIVLPFSVEPICNRYCFDGSWAKWVSIAAATAYLLWKLKPLIDQCLQAKAAWEKPEFQKPQGGGVKAQVEKRPGKPKYDTYSMRHAGTTAAAASGQDIQPLLKTIDAGNAAPQATGSQASPGLVQRQQDAFLQQAGTPGFRPPIATKKAN